MEPPTKRRRLAIDESDDDDEAEEERSAEDLPNPGEVREKQWQEKQLERAELEDEIQADLAEAEEVEDTTVVSLKKRGPPRVLPFTFKIGMNVLVEALYQPSILAKMFTMQPEGHHLLIKKYIERVLYALGPNVYKIRNDRDFPPRRRRVYDSEGDEVMQQDDEPEFVPFQWVFYPHRIFMAVLMGETSFMDALSTSKSPPFGVRKMGTAMLLQQDVKFKDLLPLVSRLALKLHYRPQLDTLLAKFHSSSKVRMAVRKYVFITTPARACTICSVKWPPILMDSVGDDLPGPVIDLPMYATVGRVQPFCPICRAWGQDPDWGTRDRLFYRYEDVL